MKLSMAIRLALTACTLVLFATPAAALADLTAETGDATEITSSSYTLHGVIYSADPDSAWTFRYGPSTSYGSVTSVQKVGLGLTFVSTTISGLKPATVYHYQLFVSQGSYPASYHPGDDRRFTTPAKSVPRTYGRVSLQSETLAVGQGRAQVRMRCEGESGALCRARVSLRTTGRVRGRRRTVSCGDASLSTGASHNVLLRPRLGADCSALLSAASHHRLRAVLRASFTGPQRPLSASVTLTR